MHTKTILIVDDNPIMLSLTKHVLRNKELKLIEATNGKEALKILNKNNSNKIDLIITDYFMPLINGLELATLLRSTKKYFSIPILLITSNKEISHQANSVYKVFNEIIHKPFSPALLLQRVTKLLI